MSEYRLNEGVEEENLYGDTPQTEGEITEPFDPKDVDIVSQPMIVANIIERLKDGSIVLEPDFQRNPDLWDDGKQSRLIESLIIRIPLPSFYFDYDDASDKYIVVDGLQRLWAIRRFASLDKIDPDRLHLTGLEYLKEYEGKIYEELPVTFQRRIREQTFTAYVIRPGTPESVRNSIFTRINTGGLQLTPAEIKNSVYRGQAADLLRELAHSDAFVKATRGKVESTRMTDCEFVNRFLAFYLLDFEKYSDNLEEYLNKALLMLKKASPDELDRCRQAFYRAMKTAYLLFGKKAFRKMNKGGRYGKINKPLFECISVCLGGLSDQECRILINHKDLFLEKYSVLLQDPAFIDVITNGTAKKNSILKRNTKVRRIISETIIQC